MRQVPLHQAPEESAAKDGEADGAEKPAKRAKTEDGEKGENEDPQETADVDMKDAEKQVQQLLCMSMEIHKRIFAASVAHKCATELKVACCCGVAG